LVKIPILTVGFEVEARDEQEKKMLSVGLNFTESIKVPNFAR